MRQRHHQKRNKDILREETKRERALQNESSFNPQIPVAPLGSASPCAPSPPPSCTSGLLFPGRLWLPSLPLRQRCPSLPRSLSVPYQPCSVWGAGDVISGQGWDRREPFPTLLSMEAFLPWGSLSWAFMASLLFPPLSVFPRHSGDPCCFISPTLLPSLSSFLSSPCLRSYSPCPFLCDPAMARLWGWRRESGRGGPGIIYNVYFFMLL